MTALEATLTFLRKVRWALLASIGFYTLVCLRAPVKHAPKPIVLYAIMLIALNLVVSMFFFRRKFIIAAETVLSVTPDDPRALASLRTGYVVIWALSEAIVLYGLVLHYMGFSFAQVSPIFMAGFVLMLFMPPRRPVESH